MFENIRADLKAYGERYNNYGKLKKIFYMCFRQELYPVVIFRFGCWAYKCKYPVVRHLTKFIYFFLNKASEIIASGHVWPNSDIGPGLRIEHWGGGTIIGGKIGKNCRIQQQVIIGFIGAGKGGGLPTLGDNVYVGAGAKILGEVKIGNNVVIGANAVVINDIPDNAVAVGIPAKVIKIKE